MNFRPRIQGTRKAAIITLSPWIEHDRSCTPSENNNVNTNLNQLEQPEIYKYGETYGDFNFEESDDAKENEVGPTICDETLNSEEASNNKKKDFPIVFNFGSRIVNEYFKAQHDGFGGAFLVGYSQFQLTNVAQKIESKEV